MPDPIEEEVALYDPGDPQGRVVGHAPRSRMRADNLPHAATAVAVRDRAGRIYVHRRTDTKDLFPGAHDVWAGGDNNVPSGVGGFLPGSTLKVDGRVIVENGALKL